MSKSQRVPIGRTGWALITIGLLVQASLLIATRADPPASDPLWYAAVSHEIAADPGRVFSGQETHPFIMRVGLTVPLALLYDAFGTTPFITALPTLFASLVVLIVGFLAASTLRARLLVMLLVATSAPLMRGATELGVDLPCGALLALVVLCLQRRGIRPRLWLTFGIVVWFVAFLVKENALWLLPVWIYAVVSDIRASGSRDAVRAYGPALAVGAVLAVAYLVWCNAVWGTPFARFGGIDTLKHEWSLQGQPAHVWIERLTWRPVVYYADVFKGALLVIAASPFVLRHPNQIWAVASSTLLVLYWFGSSSLTSYSPLPLIERMSLIALPSAVIAAGLTLDELRAHRRSSIREFVAVVVIAATVVPFTVALTRALRRGKPETDTFLALAADVRASRRPTVLVCGDSACPELASYYFGFDLPPNLTIIFPGTDDCPADARVVALVNKRRSRRLERTEGDFSAVIEAAHLPALVTNRHIALYDVGDCARLAR